MKRSTLWLRAAFTLVELLVLKQATDDAVFGWEGWAQGGWAAVDCREELLEVAGAACRGGRVKRLKVAGRCGRT